MEKSGETPKMDGKSATSFAVVISQHDAAAWLVSISTSVIEP